ncbi:MAG: protein kinase, partial [Myxococcales bacterium]|nr:protein kinase [Myxococcales bacterium]
MTTTADAAPFDASIARYRIEAQIGSGGMGVVYRGHHTWTGRPVAIKVLHPLLPDSAAYRKRFLREARAAVSLRHPNVVDVLHMDQDDDKRVYLVMELLAGQPLSAALASRGVLTLEETCAYLLPIMNAVAHAHRAGIVHRDIKPDNIFLAETSAGIVPKLLDFGVAKLVHEGGALSTTGSGQLVGTPRYMAPEQIAGTGAAPAADIWALGMVLYECLLGKHPLGAERSLPALLLKVTRGDVPPIGARCPTLPATVTAAIDHALQFEAAARWPTVEAFAEALCADVQSGENGNPVAGAQARTETTVGASPPRKHEPTSPNGWAPATRSNRKAMLVGAGAAALVSIAWVLLALLGRDKRPVTAGQGSAADGAPSAAQEPPVRGGPSAVAPAAPQPLARPMSVPDESPPLLS